MALGLTMKGHQVALEDTKESMGTSGGTGGYHEWTSGGIGGHQVEFGTPRSPWGCQVALGDTMKGHQVALEDIMDQ